MTTKGILSKAGKKKSRGLTRLACAGVCLRYLAGGQLGGSEFDVYVRKESFAGAWMG